MVLSLETQRAAKVLQAKKGKQSLRGELTSPCLILRAASHFVQLCRLHPAIVLECTEVHLVNAKAGGEDGQDEAGRITQHP